MLDITFQRYLSPAYEPSAEAEFIFITSPSLTVAVAAGAAPCANATSITTSRIPSSEVTVFFHSSVVIVSILYSCISLKVGRVPVKLLCPTP